MSDRKLPEAKLDAQTAAGVVLLMVLFYYGVEWVLGVLARLGLSL